MSELRRNPGAARATLALPVAAFLALHPIGAHAETVNVLGDPFGDPSATAVAGPNSDPTNSAYAGRRRRRCPRWTAVPRRRRPPR
jgi:hypothetical protein